MHYENLGEALAFEQSTSESNLEQTKGRSKTRGFNLLHKSGAYVSAP